MGIRIAYYEDESSEHRFRISGMNGEPMAWGEGYKELADAVHAVQVIGKAFKEGDVVVADEGEAVFPEDEELETGDEAVVDSTAELESE
jgi:uncharacterized protein YegP (UPF0339 family)